jgi:hypothetical protein
MVLQFMADIAPLPVPAPSYGGKGMGSGGVWSESFWIKLLVMLHPYSTCVSAQASWR